ncbi:MAG: PorV/PorQ family protein [Bacteroidetes bacterium]|nr:PorV/PorQ family protein [Bacteroidota bacterium]
MNKTKLVRMVALMTAALSGLLYAGGGSRVGTAGSTQLLIPVGPRGIAMGYTAITDSKGVDALFWNPANLSEAEGTSITFSHQNYIADIGVDYGAIGFTTGKIGSFALAIKSLSMNDIMVTTVQNPDGTGQTFKPAFITTGITYSILLSDRIAIGVTGNVNYEKLGEVSKTNLSFNAGISYSNLANINGLSFGIVLKNLGFKSSYDGTGLNVISTDVTNYDPSGVQYGYLRGGNQYYKIQASSEDLPTTLELGLGYHYSFNQDNSLQVNGLFQNSNYYYDEYRVGLEYAYKDMLFLRGGYVFTAQVDDKNAKETTFTSGFGVKFNLGADLNIKLDYAFQKRVLFDDSHTFGVTFEF